MQMLFSFGIDRFGHYTFLVYFDFHVLEPNRQRERLDSRLDYNRIDGFRSGPSHSS